ncbi:hypothetical protein PVAP13_2KG509200 [Panicum virgatum]|uniref:Uncharacterized protein n=1 Tax=Panicum virgatum TaxID=38727 RepID=A0A8T0WKY6_PANVG|nr:hypothetical protein PVAP13_2KG509200 [Panicum virgatum]
MFLGVAVDGSSAYCAGQNNPTQIISSEEEEDNDDANLTPASCGSKRSNSTCSTATSPSKKTRSPTLRLMDRNMSNFCIILENKNHVMRDIWNDKKKVIKDKQAALDIKISKVLAMARQLGATEATPDMWIGVMKIIQSERVMSFFIQSTEEGRLAVIKHHAGDVEAPVDEEEDSEDEDKWDDEFFEMFMDDEIELAYLYGMYDYAAHIDKYYNKAPYRQPKLSGLEWVQLKLGSVYSCYNMFRVTPELFY